MGRPKSKVQLNFISNPSNRNNTYRKRKEALKKKAYELSTLCQVPLLTTIINPSTGDVDFWPGDSQQAHDIISSYQSLSADITDNKNTLDVKSFLKEQINKMMSEKFRQLDSKIEVVNERIQLLQNGNLEHEKPLLSYPSTQSVLNSFGFNTPTPSCGAFGDEVLRGNAGGGANRNMSNGFGPSFRGPSSCGLTKGASTSSVGFDSRIKSVTERMQMLQHASTEQEKTGFGQESMDDGNDGAGFNYPQMDSELNSFGLNPPSYSSGMFGNEALIGNGYGGAYYSNFDAYGSNFLTPLSSGLISGASTSSLGFDSKFKAVSERIQLLQNGSFEQEIVGFLQEFMGNDDDSTGFKYPQMDSAPNSLGPNPPVHSSGVLGNDILMGNGDGGSHCNSFYDFDPSFQASWSSGLMNGSSTSSVGFDGWEMSKEESWQEMGYSFGC
ncbi:uncharacterized protein A4U43_C04F10160 [Asparagus officinalis]|uniref:MADS-box domain-containing protein n=1 Tax=Asparagus officinalis TaxID=4686 RepID=A0A5P1F548_ASPOF|nr:uncharacterized protein LOC109835861 [Asparagus officinalis]ONK71580.1 uncharacterized protein A4U43_C04F10160 [Asparagus officinalis]